MEKMRAHVPEGEAPEPTSNAESLLIRPISGDDKQALVDAFERLGDESCYRRFLAPRGPLSESELRYFTEVDHHDHEALVAIDPNSGHGIGVARYVRSREDPDVAELAVAVVDDWQRQGVGSRLAAALSEHARTEGITRFSALARAEPRVLKPFRRRRVRRAGLGS